MSSRASQTADAYPSDDARRAASASAWQPILDDADRERAWVVLDSIATALAGADSVRLFGPSWSGGSAGVSLFFSDLSMVASTSTWHEEACSWLAHSIEHACDDPSDLSFFSGLPGIAWTVERCREHRVHTHAADLQRLADERLFEHVGQSPWRGEYDLHRGLVGHGVYALTRLGRTNGQVLLERIVDRLVETAVETSEGITWWTAPERLQEGERRPLFPEGCFNLGLAHGVPGVIAFLGSVCAANVKTAIARPLLNRAVDWLLAQKYPDSVASCFGTHVPKGRPPDSPVASRVAWCYGDLGIAAALYAAAVDVHEQQWEAEALAIARRAAGRPTKGSGVQDATLCHGAAGNAHIFNRFYQATGEQIFLDAARRWFGHVFQLHRPGTGVGGFSARLDMPEPARSLLGNMPGLLQGAAGIGLALLASISESTPQWDVPLLVALPRGEAGCGAFMSSPPPTTSPAR